MKFIHTGNARHQTIRLKKLQRIWRKKHEPCIIFNYFGKGTDYMWWFDTSKEADEAYIKLQSALPNAININDQLKL